MADDNSVKSGPPRLQQQQLIRSRGLNPKRASRQIPGLLRRARPAALPPVDQLGSPYPQAALTPRSNPAAAPLSRALIHPGAPGVSTRPHLVRSDSREHQPGAAHGPHPEVETVSENASEHAAHEAAHQAAAKRLHEAESKAGFARSEAAMKDPEGALLHDNLAVRKKLLDMRAETFRILNRNWQQSLQLNAEEDKKADKRMRQVSQMRQHRQQMVQQKTVADKSSFAQAVSLRRTSTDNATRTSFNRVQGVSTASASPAVSRASAIETFAPRAQLEFVEGKPVHVNELLTGAPAKKPAPDAPGSHGLKPASALRRAGVDW